MEATKIQKETIKPRVRIAPSPTGPFHIGTARTALFNYLFAKKHHGSFILRIEDTDKERSKPEWEKDIIDNLLWLGLKWDEGPEPNNPSKNLGEYGPYHQSKRIEIYRNYIQKLLDEGKAYYCFCTQEEIEAKKQYFMSIGQPPRYDGQCRSLTKEQVQEYINQGKPYVIRFKVPEKKVSFKDIIHGKIEVDAGLLGDFVVAKDINSPLYNLACVIDDFEMKITHVIRGEDHLSNTPKQILLQEALGLPRPKYAHLPLILGSDRSKLSKRHGSVSFSEYKKKGYLPEAMINFMVFLGWNPGDEREFFNLFDLVEEFSLEKCQKSPAIFNVQKLIWLNGHYIRKKPIKTLTKLCIPYLIEAELIQPIYEENRHLTETNNEIKDTFLITDTQEKISFGYLQKIVSIYQERLK
ncbi:glutamate--tRNA ligase, partial [bacterium]|nr:glutamate--tRNA ligase [bacterium]